MISKKEFIRLYCDELIYEKTGVIGILDHKVGNCLKLDPLKTQKDLEDYGYPLSDVEIDGEDVIMTFDIDELSKPSNKAKSLADSIMEELDKLHKTLQASGRGAPSRSKRLSDLELEDFDPEAFDWGSEDSIK